MTNKSDPQIQCSKGSGKKPKPQTPANKDCEGTGINCGPCLGHEIIKPYICGHSCPKCTHLYLVRAKDTCAKWVNKIIRADSEIQARYRAEKLTKNIHYSELQAEKIK